MNSKQIKYFQDIVRLESFTEAAEANYISQSAISQQIKALETELGLTLLKRKNRGFELTRAGRFFYQKSQSILAELEKTVALTQNLAGEEPLLMRVGLLWGLADSKLAQAFVGFKELFPQIQLDFTVGSHEEIGQALRQQRIDLAINDQRKAFSDHYANIELTRLPLMVAVSQAHPLADRDSLELEALQPYPGLLLAVHGQEKLETDFYRDNLGFPSDFSPVYSRDQALLQILTSQAYFPTEATGTELGSAYRILPLLQDGQPIERPFYLYYRLDNAHPYTEDLLALFQKIK